jgi:hypothetical protein
VARYRYTLPELPWPPLPAVGNFMFNPDKYLSVTWRMGGRTYPILDCYGVIHEVQCAISACQTGLF